MKEEMEYIVIMDPFAYSFWTISYMSAIHFCGVLAGTVLLRAMPARVAVLRLDDKQRITVTYMVELFVTTFCLAAQIFGARQIFRQASAGGGGDRESAHPDHFRWVILAAQVVTLLYLWKLTYRERVGWTMVLHHLTIILWIQLIAASLHFADSNDNEGQTSTYLKCVLLVSLHATTEQVSILAWLCYRLNVLSPTWQAQLFYASAGQSFLVKTGLFLTSLLVYASTILLHNQENPASSHQATHFPWHYFWLVSWIPLSVTIYITQIHACNVLDAKGRQVQPQNQHENPQEDDRSQADTMKELDEEDDLSSTIGPDEAAGVSDLSQQGSSLDDEDAASRQLAASNELI